MVEGLQVRGLRARRDRRGPVAGTSVAVLAWTALVCVGFLGSALLATDTVVGGYNASAYWVSYRDGFVKRGLPGAVLETVVGGPPGLLAASVFGAALIVLALAALALLVRMTVRAVPAPAHRLVGAALVIASPFTFALVVQNRGRYDLIVVVCLVLAAWLASSRSLPWLRAAGISALVAVGAASMEIAFGFLGPLAERIGLGALALLPGLAVTAASLIAPPAGSALVAASERAAAAGLPITAAQESSISALGQNLSDALAFTASVSPLSILLCAAVLGGCYALSAYLLWVVTGRVRPRLVLAVVAVNALVALVLSAVGTDYRRWWGLAFVATAAGLVLLARDVPRVPAARHADERPWRRLLVAGLLASAVLQVFPIWPTWEPSASTNASLEHVLHHGTSAG
ncbi:hypothetical protein [Pseudonocardia sp. WMMC193]|uniref:hypothetical protein n=1 Tax=Pseudonocardia sp. WMMC193 TaxID=2911965 RepID=UPI001F28C464|nr:hypothetical protein [Pseudonocardia sp. WMMC193]MCF7552078.1 hypothetical protein [Pseudonocardia sp. WMMC193]